MVNIGIIANKNNASNVQPGNPMNSKFVVPARISIGDVFVNGKPVYGCEYSFEKTENTNYRCGKLPLDINSLHADVYVNVEVAYPGAKMVSAYGIDTPAKIAGDTVFSEKFAIGELVVFLRPQDKTIVENAREAILEQTAEITLQKEFTPTPKPAQKRTSEVVVEFSGHYLG